MSVTIEISHQARSRLRIAPSPLMETVAALGMLSRPNEVPFLYRTWVEWAVTTYASDPRVSGLLGWARSWESSCPISLPVPQVGGSSFEMELACLRERNVAECCTDLPGASSSTSLNELCDALEIFWSCAVAPAWTRIVVALEEDIFFRAKTLANAGSDALLASLHPKIAWADPTLEITGGRGDPPSIWRDVVLVPLMFCGDAPFVHSCSDAALTVCYQSRGIATLLAESEAVCREVQETKSCLEKVLGPTKANILVAVEVPMTTTSLAVRLVLAPSTVSKHIHDLCESGLVNRRRVGKSVYYGLSPRGTALIEAMH